jgi:hypothetical protein
VGGLGADVTGGEAPSPAPLGGAGSAEVSHFHAWIGSPCLRRCLRQSQAVCQVEAQLRRELGVLGMRAGRFHAGIGPY